MSPTGVPAERVAAVRASIFAMAPAIIDRVFLALRYASLV
jgi:hypothetical protein